MRQITEVAIGECERQKVGFDALVNLLQAYKWVADLDVASFSVFHLHSIGQRIDSVNNYGYRYTPVTFANGGSSANPQDIPRLVDQMFEVIPTKESSQAAIQSWIKELMWIHPFIDGNGRTGWVLYNYFMQTMHQPHPLPDLNF